MSTTASHALQRLTVRVLTVYLCNIVHMSSAHHVALDFPPRRSNKRTQHSYHTRTISRNSTQFFTIPYNSPLHAHHSALLLFDTAYTPTRNGAGPMRPIDLQSADDLRHLVEKLRAAAHAKTQAQLLGDPADLLRRRRCTRAWKSARFSWRR